MALRESFALGLLSGRWKIFIEFIRVESSGLCRHAHTADFLNESFDSSDGRSCFSIQQLLVLCHFFGNLLSPEIWPTKVLLNVDFATRLDDTLKLHFPTILHV